MCLLLDPSSHFHCSLSHSALISSSHNAVWCFSSPVLTWQKKKKREKKVLELRKIAESHGRTGTHEQSLRIKKSMKATQLQSRHRCVNVTPGVTAALTLVWQIGFLVWGAGGVLRFELPTHCTYRHCFLCESAKAHGQPQSVLECSLEGCFFFLSVVIDRKHLTLKASRK